ncbi:MAG: SDR family oxidoreductase [Gemmatimonadetes bacterium]|jgi:NAD(P)-dependent dehydrogenase (short-subunit alcohol dehydrogenase family)|nr:SDR family oxidoreductase [Gemmatimonadota bacterium]MBT6148567.1 SDR family oxidoreductase [Gemmatimonadota bacterium]MBT7859597.1 SDR family oxidoreductase [Gemmatimonadota bacterium]
MAGRLQDKVAIVTGGTTGIGLATAKRFVDEGATVILTGTNPETLEAARSELGDQVQVIASDASKESDVKSLFEQVAAKHGKIDVLFLNAGIARFAPWTDHSVEDFDRQFAINVRGPWLAIKYAIPHLRDGASVIATTSVANQMGMQAASAYSATKAALKQLVSNAAAELSPRGIRVNAVSPGPIETPIFSKTGMSDEQLQEMSAGIESQIALGRFGKSEEVANVALFLASDESSFVQGQEYVVDGGISI